MANKFCRLLSNGYKINVNHDHLEWSPCCFYSKKTPLMDHEQFEAALNYTSSATSWLPECHQCKQMEESGVPGLSPRQVSFRKIPIDDEAGKCSSLEINLDLMCNAACLSCGGYASSTWKKYEYKHKLHDYGPVLDQSDQFFNELITRVDLSSVQNLYILGGEPMYGETNLKMLKHLHKIHPKLDQVMLEYQTNGSISPSAEVLELWKGFKSVNFSMSIDGIGNRFEYLRWPLKWYRVEKNIDFLMSVSNAMFDVNATVSPLNVLYFDEIEQWTTDKIPADRLTPRLHNPVRANRCMPPIDLNLSTPELRNAVLLKYGTEHKLSKIFSNLEINTDYQRMFDYVNKHDALRRLSWQETFPDVVKYYNNIIK